MLYGAQMSRHRGVAATETVHSADSQTHLSELDHLAIQTRHVGQLSEPLADSVLEYTLRRLKPGAHSDLGALHDLEVPNFPDSLTQLMDESPTFTLPNATIPATSLNGNLFPSATNQGDGSDVPRVSASDAWQRTTPVAPVQYNGYDWWQFNLDNIQQPILPYDDMFNFDFSM